MKKYILITGGAGFIGSHAVVAFEQAGYTTAIVDNMSNGSEQSLDGIKKILGYAPISYRGNIKDTNFLEDIFTRHMYDGVIHFAALKAVEESCSDPIKYFENNVGSTLQLVKTMQKYGVQNIIFSSSCTVYGRQQSPIVETMSIGDTNNPYGTSKVLCEYILQDMARFGGLKVISLRYFNPIGAHPSGHIGEKIGSKPSNIFPYILKVIKKDLPELHVFGGDYDTPDGTGVRDYIDIMDLVGGHIAAYEHLVQQDAGFYDTYNLGTGKGTSVLELIKAVEKVSKITIPYVVDPRRPGDIDAVWAGCDKAKNVLGWQAQTPIEDSIQHALTFAQQST